MAEIKLHMIAGGPCRSSDEPDDCGNGDCPTVYGTDHPGTIAVQGYTVDRETPEGESIVTIPEKVLKEAVRALGW